MSMLSLQADKLRKYAERLRQLANGAVNQGFPARQDLFESAAEMREAADTIISLRDRLQAAEVGGTCEWVLEHSGTMYDKWRCSECGYLFVEPRCDQGYTDLEPNFCPSCGQKVVG